MQSAASRRAPRHRLPAVRALVIPIVLASLLLACSGSSKRPTSGNTRETITTPQAAEVAPNNSTGPNGQATGTPGATPTPSATPSVTPTPEITPSPTATPSPEPTEPPAPVQTLADGAHGYVVTSSATIQAAPNSTSAVVGRLRYEQQLDLQGKVRGERTLVGNQTWAMAIQDWSNTWYKVDGGYVYAAYVWVPRPGEVLPESLARGEHWVDVDIAAQTAKLMIGSTVVYTAPVTTGKNGYETPTGHWRVGYQVLNETMTSGQAGINDPAEVYDVHNVLYTQYFDSSGDALHLNYWQPESVFGNARTSHGCVGLYIQDAQYFWMFGQQGMRVEITSAGRILPPPAAPPAPARTATATQAPAAVRTVAPTVAPTTVVPPTRTAPQRTTAAEPAATDPPSQPATTSPPPTTTTSTSGQAPPTQAPLRCPPGLVVPTAIRAQVCGQ